MIGWSFGIYRQINGGDSPATFDSKTGVILAYWDTELRGLDWIETLVARGEALCLGGNGYPVVFTAPIEHLRPVLCGELPCLKPHSRTKVNLEELDRCTPVEWALIRIFDLS
ncbi:hypothetical protein [Luteolibacter sp. Populi]|uniref:hypothetical protein n=1 Tax=Luteolibacter sp. Populi TaxID=3230487 RepID=UPI0034672F9C